MSSKLYPGDDIPLCAASWYDVCKPAITLLDKRGPMDVYVWGNRFKKLQLPSNRHFFSLVCWLEHFGFVKYSDGKWRRTQKAYVMPDLFEGEATGSSNRTALFNIIVDKHKTSIVDVLGDVRFGAAVLARDEFFGTLNELGMEPNKIAVTYGQKLARVNNCIDRYKNNLLRSVTYGQA